MKTVKLHDYNFYRMVPRNRVPNGRIAIYKNWVLLARTGWNLNMENINAILRVNNTIESSIKRKIRS